MYLVDEDNDQKRSSAVAATSFARRPVFRSSFSFPVSSGGDAAAHIQVGSYYELDHSKLPSATPSNLSGVRIVMVRARHFKIVSGKSRRNVSLKFPSAESLEVFAEESEDGKLLPSMARRATMVPELADEALYRRVPPHEIAARRNDRSFWIVPPVERGYLAAKNGECFSLLKSAPMLHWGRRRIVRFLSPRSEARKDPILAIRVNENSESRNEVSDDHLKGSDVEDEDYEPFMESRATSKRRRLQCTYKTEDADRPKRQNANQIAIYKQTRKRVIKKFISRWSAERYKRAEVNMLKILKEMGAAYGNPVLRPALRNEARKLIGDMGLLDHLLKHMAGKVAPGGKDRFMRRHKSEGAMEYWLESADLVKIRKEAGVQDPSWTPAPGWKLGDNPTQDPICAREYLKNKEQISKIREQMEEKMGKRLHDDFAIVISPNSSVSSQKLDNENVSRQLKELLSCLVNKKTKLEEQMMSVSESLSELEDEMGKLRSLLSDEQKNAKATETTVTYMESSSPSSGVNRGEHKNKSSTIATGLEQNETAVMEDRALKIERLKSAFRICKPQGSFLWPGMAISPHVDDHIAVPTPPSVSSSTATKPGQSSTPSPLPQGMTMNYTPHPVKPLAERHPVGFSLVKSSAEIAIPPPINLNAAPGSQTNESICVSLSRHQSSASMFTYQRRYHSVTTSPSNSAPCLGENRKECTTSASISVGVGTSLALASPSSSYDNNPREH